MEIVLVALALLVGVSFGLTVFGLSFALMIQEQSKRSGETLKSELQAERGLRLMAETERDGLKRSFEMQSKAIEANALPWIAKNDRLEARFETEALDEMARPGYDYQDMVEGLGGTR